MILCIDIGNTRAKLALHTKGAFSAFESLPHAALPKAVAQRCAQHPDLAGIALCSVAASVAGLSEVLAAQPCPQHWVSAADLPAAQPHAYRTPHTLGADRVAALLGARSLRPRSPLLVIDAGTCITIDVMSAEGTFLGGNISPGVELRLRALHEHTARLPLVSPEGEHPELGVDTPTAIRSGVLRGIGHEIEGYIRHCRQKYGPISVFLTGGAAQIFPISTENCIFADEYLVLRGLVASFLRSR